MAEEQDGRQLLALPVGEFLDRTASASPTPGGGSVAAVTGALAGALVAMVARLTDRKKGYEQAWELAGEAAGRADRLTADPAPEVTLTATGRFAAGLPADPDANLVVRAARALRARYGVDGGARLRLEKNLPVAAGIGGGSSDAAAALRLLARLWDLPAGDDELAGLGRDLGADIPACVAGLPALVSGTGEIVETLPALPECGLVLANPGVPVSTSAVFGARSGAWSQPAAWSPPGDLDGLISGLAPLGNDLTAAAAAMAPEITRVLEALERLPAALLARMSGSGGTCFAVFPDLAKASGAAAELQAEHPRWWVAATALLSARPEVTGG